ncbi:MAG: hypothetical protein QMD85_02285, partial [Candidatus Aenigmarchaeota archaeon]|nr:hypothetical protein [Candidatus Aenigmarchaeota archaeon]MDI6722366.1 hypothetical protein [Candidatus Aenigmarchaeota archaeon]
KILLKKLVNDLMNDTRTNEWEREFLASISGQILDRDLSERQMAVLDKIKKKCAPDSGKAASDDNLGSL